MIISTQFHTSYYQPDLLNFFYKLFQRFDSNANETRDKKVENFSNLKDLFQIHKEHRKRGRRNY